jgi:hypothetical protein
MTKLWLLWYSGSRSRGVGIDLRARKKEKVIFDTEAELKASEELEEQKALKPLEEFKEDRKSERKKRIDELQLASIINL